MLAELKVAYCYHLVEISVVFSEMRNQSTDHYVDGHIMRDHLYLDSGCQ